MVRKIVMTLIAAGAIGLYVNGTFDPALAHGSVPLNLHECASNMLGNTVCGKDLERIREEQDDTKADLENILGEDTP